MEETRSPLSPFYGMLAAHLLMVLVGVCWSAYWTMEFGAEASGEPRPSGLLAMAAVLCGFAALAMMSGSIMALSPRAGGMPFQLWNIPLGGGVFVVLWLAVTTLVFDRIVTSELFLIPLWAVLQLCVLYVLVGCGWLNARQTAVSAVLTAAAFLVGLVCYVLHYRLDDHGRFLNGLVPYAGIAATSLTVAGMLVFNRSFRTSMIR